MLENVLMWIFVVFTYMNVTHKIYNIWIDRYMNMEYITFYITPC